METAKQNTQQNIEENDALKQFMGLLNRQGMGEQSQDFMELFQYVAGMQLQLAVMTDELQGVKQLIFILHILLIFLLLILDFMEGNL